MLVAIFATTLVASHAWPDLGFFSRTGRLWPIRKIDVLDNAVAVTGWNSAGLILVDGRTIPLPGVTSLPALSPALTHSTKRGVEIHPDGRVFVLVQVHHWCGNDPVREHLAKVDLSQLLAFLQVGQPTHPATIAHDYPFIPAGGTFSEHGWRIEEFMAFQAWTDFR